MNGPKPVRYVTVTIDGITHAGTYYVQSEIVYVQSPLAAKATQVVGGSPPKTTAMLLLSEIVRGIRNMITFAFLALAAWTATVNQSQADTGTVRVFFGAAGVVVGVANGKGTLTFHGKTYPFELPVRVLGPRWRYPSVSMKVKRGLDMLNLSSSGCNPKGTLALPTSNDAPSLWIMAGGGFRLRQPSAISAFTPRSSASSARR